MVTEIKTLNQSLEIVENGKDFFILKKNISSINLEGDEVFIRYNKGIVKANYNEVTNPLTSSAQELAEAINNLV